MSPLLICVWRIVKPLCRRLLLLILLGISITTYADVDVRVGPTEFPRGEAAGAQDITINNGLFALAFAVDSAPPWGIARGGIVDIAIVRNGVVDHLDFVNTPRLNGGIS